MLIYSHYRRMKMKINVFKSYKLIVCHLYVLQTKHCIKHMAVS